MKFTKKYSQNMQEFSLKSKGKGRGNVTITSNIQTITSNIQKSFSHFSSFIPDVLY